MSGVRVRLLEARRPSRSPYRARRRRPRRSRESGGSPTGRPLSVERAKFLSVRAMLDMRVTA
jgi:hypothetical protein